MSRTACPPTLYVVAWDDLSIVKAGYTGQRRWRDWEIRGARVVRLQGFSHYDRAFAAEQDAHDALSSRWRLAFGSELESRVLLGRCGGWRETYMTTPLADALGMLICIADQHADMDASAHPASACDPAMPRTNVRTVRTDASVQIEPSLTLSDARVRVHPGFVGQVCT